jgi:hypothetical protein
MREPTMKNSDLVCELMAMRDAGITVPDAAIFHAVRDDLSKYDAISVAELASLYCELYPGEVSDE